MKKLAVAYVRVDALTPYAKNARTHSEAQISQLVASVRKFGWTNPILVDGSKGIIAGHGRLMAAKALGMTEVPVIELSGLTAAEKRAYILADNKLALNAGWDEALLSEELRALGDAGLNLEDIGFSTDELTSLLADKTAGLTDPDDVPEVPADPVSRKGDLWILGNHRVMCGDSLSLDDVRQLLAGRVPDLANCDPPYGISIVKGSAVGGAKPFGKPGRGHGPAQVGPALRRGRVHGPAKNAIIQPGTYAPIIGDDTTDTAIRSYAVLLEIGVPVIALWGGNYFADALPPSRCWLVWDKETTGTFADAELAWTNQDAVVKLLRHRWSGLMKASERGQKRVHPTQKPVALAEWVAETLAPKARTVIDLFLGSGSTLIAAQNRGMSCFGMEMSPEYVDAIVKRWQAFTGLAARLDGDMRTFDEIAAERARKAA